MWRWTKSPRKYSGSWTRFPWKKCGTAPVRRDTGTSIPATTRGSYSRKRWNPLSNNLANASNSGLTTQAKLQCMGILQGIHLFETESESEYKDWAVDAPGEYFVSVYQEWHKGTKSKTDISEVKQFVRELCPSRAKLCK